jgi:hypothetical protein
MSWRKLSIRSTAYPTPAGWIPAAWGWVSPAAVPNLAGESADGESAQRRTRIWDADDSFTSRPGGKGKGARTGRERPYLRCLPGSLQCSETIRISLRQIFLIRIIERQISARLYRRPISAAVSPPWEMEFRLLTTWSISNMCRRRTVSLRWTPSTARMSCRWVCRKWEPSPGSGALASDTRSAELARSNKAIRRPQRSPGLQSRSDCSSGSRKRANKEGRRSA